MSVWEKLSAIDCNKHTEKKGKFTYLSWTWAWAMVKQNYPDATYKIEKDKRFPDDTMEEDGILSRVKGVNKVRWCRKKISLGTGKWVKEDNGIRLGGYFP